MGRLIDGSWVTTEGWEKDQGGRFQRMPTTFRDAVSADRDARFPAVAGRYHLYVSYACPWAHRTLVVRALKGLEHAIGVSVVHWFMDDDGWTFAAGDGVVPDPNEGASMLRELYVAADPRATARVTVPVLWDTRSRAIVNNESSEIIRFLNREFDDVAGRPALDLYPAELRAEIDAINERVYDTVNNGVYKCGFAGTQEAYDEALHALFDSLDWLEGILSRQRWLAGDRFTEADVRLFTTLLRFDPVYVTHFKCNLRRLSDYDALWAYTREIAQVPEVAGTIRMDHIKSHYFRSHTNINPRRIEARGPILDFGAPHGRERLGGQPVLP